MGWNIVFRLSDNNGGRAEVSIRPAPAGGYAGALAKAGTLAALLGDVTTAHIVHYMLEQSTPLTLTPADPTGADVERAGILLYRNGNDVSSIFLPSVLGLLVEASGPYAGGRITRTSAGVQGLLTNLDTLLVGILDPAGRPYGGTFSIGSVTGGVPQ